MVLNLSSCGRSKTVVENLLLRCSLEVRAMSVGRREFGDDGRVCWFRNSNGRLPTIDELVFHGVFVLFDPLFLRQARERLSQLFHCMARGQVSLQQRFGLA